MANTISDKDAYEILFDSAMEQSASGVPFFLAIYTFGTHASLDSADETFGDGTDARTTPLTQLSRIISGQTLPAMRSRCLSITKVSPQRASM